MSSKNRGWSQEPVRHGLAARGVKTAGGRYKADPAFKDQNKARLRDGGIIKNIEILGEGQYEEGLEVELDLLDIGRGQDVEDTITLFLTEDEVEQLEEGKVIDIDYHMESVDASRDPHKVDMHAYPVFDGFEIGDSGRKKIDEWKEDYIEGVKDVSYLEDEESEEEIDWAEEKAENLKEEIK